MCISFCNKSRATIKVIYSSVLIPLDQSILPAKSDFFLSPIIRNSDRKHDKKDE